MATRKPQTKSPRPHVIVGDSADTPDAVRKHMSKHDFAVRLGKLWKAQGWNRAELARQASMHGPVEVTRDNVSNYLRGNSMPTAPKLESLAASFGMTAEELCPNYLQNTIQSGPANTKMEVSANPKKSWLQVNRLVYTSTGTKILTLLEADDASSID